MPQKAGYGGIPPESGFPGRGGITVENPFNLKRKTYIEPFYLRFTCYDADGEVVTNGWGKRLPSGEWVASVSPSDEPLFNGALRAHQVHAVNASGWAVAVDDVIGDERYRLRRLYYCVIHEPRQCAVIPRWGCCPISAVIPGMT